MSSQFSKKKRALEEAELFTEEQGDGTLVISSKSEGLDDDEERSGGSPRIRGASGTLTQVSQERGRKAGAKKIAHFQTDAIFGETRDEKARRRACQSA